MPYTSKDWMMVKIEAAGSTYKECLDRLGVPSRALIEIRRRCNYNDDGLKGCIVDIQDEAPREFEDFLSAIAYLSDWLGRRDAWIAGREDEA